MIISVGDGAAHRRACCPSSARMLERPLADARARPRLQARRRIRLASRATCPRPMLRPRVWQKLMVYAGEQSRHRGRPLHGELMRRAARSRRGGRHQPPRHLGLPRRPRAPRRHLLAATPPRPRGHRHRRHAPSASGEWFAIVDELTDETGLVTSEMVPAFHATAPDTGAAACGLPT